MPTVGAIDNGGIIGNRDQQRILPCRRSRPQLNLLNVSLGRLVESIGCDGLPWTVLLK